MSVELGAALLPVFIKGPLEFIRLVHRRLDDAVVDVDVVEGEQQVARIIQRRRQGPANGMHDFDA